MSRSHDAALRLMLVDDSVEEAEGIVSGLRNAGIAVRPLRPTSLDELTAMLASQSIDLVLASHPCALAALPDVMHRVAGTGKDIPVIAVVEQVDTDGFADILGGGARGIALRHKPAQLLAAIRSE